ncbi:hypothetical protein HDV00_008979 [Rhizophlyctis rosea]|nr:hypothetical protein HDV00_008979 [Rhizophlyctis rosea]
MEKKIARVSRTTITHHKKRKSAPTKHVENGVECEVEDVVTEPDTEITKPIRKKQKKIEIEARAGSDDEDDDLALHLDVEEDFITKTEKVHMGRLKQLVKMKKLYVPRKKGDRKDDTDHLRNLKAYARNVNEDGSLPVTYQFKNDGQFGRLYAKGMAAPYFPSALRDFLFPNYKDVDMKAAVFTIYRFFSERYDIPSPELLKYIQERETILKKKKLTKEKINALMNMPVCQSQDKFIFSLHDWIHKTLLPRLKDDSEYKDLWTAIAKSDKKSKEVSFLCHCYQTVERRILIHMSEFFENLGWNVGALIYDGLLLENQCDKSLDDVLLRDCERSIHEALGIRVTLVDKPRDVDPTFLEKNNLNLEDDYDQDDEEKEDIHPVLRK